MRTAFLKILPLSAALLVGCAEDIFEGERGVPVSLTVALQDRAITRAGVDIQSSQFDQGETFYAYFPEHIRVGEVTAASSTTFTTSDNAGNTTAATTPYFNAGQSSATVHAYYPYSTVQVTNATSSFSVQQNQNTDAAYKLSDLMYATADISKGASATVTQNLTFTHKMSKIIVTATGDGVGNITDVRIIGGHRTINISTPESCTLGSTLTDANSTSSYVNVCSGNSATTASCAALIPPQTVDGDFLLVETEQGNVTYSLDSKTFVSGHSYAFNLSINAAAIGTTVAITPWGDQDQVTVNPTLTVGGSLIISGEIVDQAFTYNGSAQTPAFSVTKNDETVAPANYTSLWFGNTNAGNAMLLVQGNAETDYASDYGIQNFTIHPQDISSSSATPASIADIASRDYNGSAYEPTLTVTNHSSVAMTVNTDYTVAYSDGHTNAGNYTATVTGIGNYTGTLQKDYTIDKAAQAVSLSETELQIEPGHTGTFTVTRLGDGVITATSSDTNIATITSIDQNTGVVTVTRVASGAVAITVTVAEDANYQAYTANDKTVDVNDFKLTDNPLWWVAQYNLAQNKTSFVAAHSTSSQYCFNFNDAKVASVTISGTAYHQPDFSEQVSIIPYDNSKNTGSGSYIFGFTGTLASPTEFVEKGCTVGGASVASTTSIWGKNADKDSYAIRFIGTSYCSAWHYKWVTSPCNGLLIESYLLSGVTTLDQAKAKMAEANFTSTIFTGTANAEAANQTPTSSTLTTNAFCQRFLPACGWKNGSSGVADLYQGASALYWSSTADGVSAGFIWYFTSSGILGEDSGSQSSGYSVRLFRNVE